MSSIVDSVTKQEIQDGEAVVLMLLVNATSQSNDMGLMARSNDRVKVASLPIHGVWDNNQFTPNDENTVAVRSVLESFNSTHESLSELIASLWSDATVDVEQPSWNCSNKMEFSMFVTKEASLEKVANTTIVKQRVGIHDVESDILKIQGFADKCAAAAVKLNGISGKGDDYYDAMYQMDEYENIIRMRSSDYVPIECGETVPYAATALKRSGETPFSTDLLITLNEENFAGAYGSLGEKELMGNPPLPEFYGELYRSVHEGVSIIHSLNLLGIHLAPTAFCNTPKRDTSMMELMGQVLAEDIRKHVEECRDYSDEPAAEIDRLITPLKSCVADALRERNKIPGLDR
jgi:hypothetical protein